MSPNLAVVLGRGGAFGTHQRSSDGSGAPLGPCGPNKTTYTRGPEQCPADTQNTFRAFSGPLHPAPCLFFRLILSHIFAS